MKNANKKLLGLAAVAACGLVLNAGATPIPPVVDLATYGVGYYTPTALGAANNVGYVQDLISVYNGGSPTFAPGETYTVSQGANTPSSPLGKPLAFVNSPNGGNAGNNKTSDTITLATASTYLVCQWDGPNGGDAVYYIAGLSGQIDLENDLPNKSQYGLSGYWYVSASEPANVPEGTSTVVLLGAALTGLSLIRSRFSK